MRTSLTNTAAAKATGVLTASSQALAGETVIIGAIVYTFAASLTAPFQVLIGAALADSLDNLKSAINATAGAGSTYATGTTAHPLVTATTNTNTAQTIEAISPGVAANSLGTTETMSAAAWGAATLTGGLENSDVKTRTAAGNGTSVAVDTLTATDWLIEITIYGLTAGKKARISFPDSVDAFSASLPGPAFSFVGPIAEPITKSLHARDFPGLRIGTASAVLRCNLDAIDSAASISYGATLASA